MVRAFRRSAPDTAFGGPIYYGHTPDGHSRRNCFFYQTRAANSVFDCLTEAQRRNAVITMGPRTNPGEGMGSVQFGHHYRIGNNSGSWVSAHGSRGCSQANVMAGGGAGLLYCFSPDPPPAQPARQGGAAPAGGRGN